MEPQRDRGFTLIEILVVIFIAGIVTSLVVMAVRGAVDNAESEGACPAEKRQLVSAAEAYFAETGSPTLPDAGGAEGYEQSLVDFGLLRRPSRFYDLDTNGDMVQVVDSPCIV